MVVAGLLIFGGGLAALALILVVYSTSEPQSSATTPVIVDAQQTTRISSWVSTDQTTTAQLRLTPAVEVEQTNTADRETLI